MRAQASAEFIFMIMTGTAMILIFTVIFSELYQDNLTDKKNIIMQDFGYSIQNEFLIASQTLPGYTRTFDVPEKLEGFTYEATIIGNVLLINYTINTFAFPIPPVSGELKKGANVLVNENNSLCLNC